MADLFDEGKESNRGRIVKAVIVTYLIVFFATLGFTGVIDYGKAAKPVVTAASKYLKKKDEKKEENKKLEPTQQVPIQPMQTAPMTLPPPAAPQIQAAAPDDEAVKVTEANAADLARVYSNMDSDKAAAVFNNLTDEEIILLLKSMQKPSASDIFAEMDSSRVARITSKMMTPATSSIDNSLTPEATQ